MDYSKEKALVTYGYIIYMFGKLAENNLLIHNNIEKLKRSAAKQLNVNVANIRFD